jgi:transcriptional regulator with XRE-family HTH domain
MLFKDKGKEQRGRLGLSQKQLAEKAGIGFRTIVTYESGKRFPQSAQLYKLAKALGVSTEYLKDDSIEDPQYGIDRMDYVEELRQTNGKKDAIDLEEMLKANQALFAGGEISDEAKIEYFNAIVQAYVECGAAAKAKFGRKKDPERAID